MAERCAWENTVSDRRCCWRMRINSNPAGGTCPRRSEAKRIGTATARSVLALEEMKLGRSKFMLVRHKLGDACVGSVAGTLRSCDSTSAPGSGNPHRVADLLQSPARSHAAVLLRSIRWGCRHLGRKSQQHFQQMLERGEVHGLAEVGACADHLRGTTRRIAGHGADHDDGRAARG